MLYRVPEQSVVQIYKQFAGDPFDSLIAPRVQEAFEEILRFWLKKGVDGFRVDVATGMVKRAGLPDVIKQEAPMGGVTAEEIYSVAELEEMNPAWAQPGIHEINRRFRKIVDEFDDRVLCAEAWTGPLDRMAKWVRPDEYHQNFNFDYLGTPWVREKIQKTVTNSITAFAAVGAPSTWVLSNHDVIRHVTRFGYDEIPRQGDGIGPKSPQPDEALGLRRGRAATAFMLGLPGGAYIYQGEELGLPEHTTIGDAYREDPTFFRTKGDRVGRDGCRVPLPWEGGINESNGFSTTGKTWLPHPASYAKYARDKQEGVAGSTLELYKRLLKLRKSEALGAGNFRWATEYQDKNTLAYINNGVLVLTNFGPDPVVVPAGEVLVTTQHDLRVEGELEIDQTVWIKL